MSDVSQGPGWWMASDGKWYPPESHPDYVPPPPPPPTAMPAPTAPSVPSVQPQTSAPPFPYTTPPSYRPPPQAPGPAFATYGARLGGWLIDWLILIAICVPISVVTHSFHYSHVATTFNGFSSDNRNFSYGLPGSLLSPLIVLAYGMLMIGSGRGQTVGMMATGVRAVKAQNGGPVGYGAALGRAAFEELMAAVLFIPWVIDMLFPLWDPQKQTLHDKVSGTIVVRADRSA